MPMYYQFVTDFMAHKEKYSTELALQKRKDLPMLIIHGTADVPVPVASAMQLKVWKPEAELLLLEGVDHVFGGSHPWEENPLGTDGMKLCRSSVIFLSKIFS
jgi:pimeloyl-ACP methyl ester carboxylesterase